MKQTRWMDEGAMKTVGITTGVKKILKVVHERISEATADHTTSKKRCLSSGNNNSKTNKRTKGCSLKKSEVKSSSIKSFFEKSANKS